MESNRAKNTGNKRLSVLLAEDHPGVRDVMERMLGETGWHIVVANDGQEAVDLFDFTFSLVILDYNMPGLNGDEVAKTIREREKVAEIDKPVYILGLTANIAHHGRTCMAAGMNDVVEKPIPHKELQDLLGKLLNALAPIQR